MSSTSRRCAIPGCRASPALNRDFPYEEYAREARRVGIARHAAHGGRRRRGRHRGRDRLCRRASRAGRAILIVGAIAACRPEEAGFAAYLERQRSNPLVKGFRRVLHVVPDELSEGALFRENMKRLAGTGLTFDLVRAAAPDPEGDRARRPGAGRAVRARPLRRARHQGQCRASLARAHERDRQAAERRRQDFGRRRLCRCRELDGRDAEAYVEHTIGAFGWDRVVWGSDWPVCTLGGGLSTWVAATHALIAGASADEKAKLLSGNARRIWRL